MVILHTTNEQKNQHILDYFDKKGIKHKAKALKTGDYTFMIEACPELGFIKDTYFTDELCILAQYVESGSYLCFEGEDEDTWKWAFDNGKVKQI